MGTTTLMILPDLKTKKIDGDRFVVTEKFYDGVLEFVKYWPGPVAVFMEASPGMTDNLDNIEIRSDNVPFHMGLLDYASLERKVASDASIVLGSTSYRQNHLSDWCRNLRVPCVYVAEYNLKTRLQIIDADTHNILMRLRRYLWEFLQERKQRKAISDATGIQCNGTPTFEAYRRMNPLPFLYFDSRMSEEMMASDGVVDARLTECLSGRPLRLLFSGRLLKIKGADHVVSVAEELQKRGMRFEMSICGDGELSASMASQIAEKGLSHVVEMKGVLDFKTELVPYTQKHTDLFVCCHRQGDPSCTYLETMSCGVPIVGYDNEAFLGVAAESKAGWPAPMNRPEQMARKIIDLDRNREDIALASRTSLHFSRSHTFEKTFKRRVEHLQAVASAPIS
jgi:colanic acid/amylovoran biosynthesis glycosyltransferase